MGDSGGSGDEGDCAGNFVLIDHFLHGGGDGFVVLASLEQKREKQQQGASHRR